MDVRENILVRILTVLESVRTGQNAFRNRHDIQENLRPCLVLMDGDEEANDRDNDRSGRAPRRVRMSPEIYVLIGSTSEDIGTELNVMRAQVIDALTSDSELQDLMLNGHDLVYEGAQSIFEDGRKVEGVLVLRFGCTYLLRLSDLALSG